MGGGAFIIAIAAYYLNLVKPIPKARDVEDTPIVAPAAPAAVIEEALGYPPMMMTQAHFGEMPRYNTSW